MTLEAVLDPERAIIDPHLHLWDIVAAPGALQEPQRFLVAEAAETIFSSGHAITHTVFVECHAMYRRDGPPELRSLGETEFANGMAAMAASGSYGGCQIAHRIVSNADLCLGDAVAAVIERHRAAAGERFRGVRMSTSYSPAGLFGGPAEAAARDRLADPKYREGARVLARMGLSLDVWCLHPQLEQLAALADAVPDLPIVLDHVGTPDLRGLDTGRENEVFAEWATAIADLAERPNVVAKLGGLGMDVSAPISAETGNAGSPELAGRWRHYIERCIEAFGPSRCMFESNYPPDQAAGSYRTIWNAYKIIAVQYSEDEQDQLFRRTAARTYEIELSPEED